MKKLLLVTLLIIPMIFASCGDEEVTTEPETHPPVEMTTAPFVPLEVQSPPTCDTTLPEGIDMHISSLDFESFTEISDDESLFPGMGHDKVLESDKAQYFFLDAADEIHAFFFDEKKNITFVARYNSKSGYLKFVADDTKSWYYDENGDFLSVVYTFKNDSPGAAPVYTFYKPDGTKDVIRTMGGWYTPALDRLSEQDTAVIITEYAYTVEATAQY